MNKGFTQVPNEIFDKHLSILTLAELKVLLIIIRQTLGWVNKKTGKRKARDRITHAYFIRKTGLSRKIISKTIQALCDKGLIVISDYRGNCLNTPQQRKGKSYLYYSFSGLQREHFTPSTYARNTISPVNRKPYNKRNYRKEKETKETVKTIEDIIRSYRSKYLK